MQNSEYTLHGIPGALVWRMWPFAEPYVKRALDHSAGEISTADLKKLCEERDVQLWLVRSADRIVGAVTTEIVVYPNRKHCRVITIAGSGFDKWVKMVDKTLAEWAMTEGCDALEAHVRRGFVSKLAPLGYKHLHSVVIKNLDKIAHGMEE